MLEQTDYVLARGRDRVIEGITAERVLRSLNTRTKNYLGRLNPVRSLFGLGYPGRKNVFSEIFVDICAEQVSKKVNKEGICQGLKLPEPILTELLDFAEETPVFGNRNRSYGFYHRDLDRVQDRVGVQFTQASYFNIYEQCAAVRQLANDPVIREIASRYVGPLAKHLGCNMWWSYPSPTNAQLQSEYAQLFHYDLDDYRFIKFFFYLTDVDSESGPHVFVKKSHKNKPWSHIFPMRRLSDAEVEATYRSEDILTLTGKAGDGFAEDTFGIHKGAVPTDKRRLILQLYYGVSQGYTDDRCDPNQLQCLTL